MKFTMKKELPYSSDAVWQLISDPDFSKASYALANADFEVIDNTTEGNKQTLQATITFQTPLPTIAAKLLGKTHLVYDQTLQLLHDEKRAEWTISVQGAGSKVQIYGQWGVSENGEECIRFFEGNVNVKLAFIGGKVEKEIAKRLEQAQNAIIQLIHDKLG